MKAGLVHHQMSRPQRRQAAPSLVHDKLCSTTGSKGEAACTMTEEIYIPTKGTTFPVLVVPMTSFYGQCHSHAPGQRKRSGLMWDPREATPRAPGCGAGSSWWAPSSL